VLENVLLTTTQGLNVNLVEGQDREGNLRDQGLWGGLIGGGATPQNSTAPENPG